MANGTIPENKKRITFTLEKALIAELEKTCDELGLTMSQFVSLCLNSVLCSNGKTEKEVIAGMISDYIKNSKKITFR